MESNAPHADQPDAAKPAPPKLRWFQFSLRTLLIFMTVSGALFGLFARKAEQARKQHAAVEALQKLGYSHIEYDYQVDANGSLLPGAPPSGPLWLRQLLTNDFFDDVICVDCGLEEWGGRASRYCAHKKGFTHECDPTCGRQFATDAALNHIPALPQLATLNLYEGIVTDAGLENLAGATELKRLDLDRTFVSDAGLRHLGKLIQMRTLLLNGNRVTDSGLEHLRKMTELTSLELCGTSVTGTGLISLSGMTHLKHLALAVTKVTDANLEYLPAFPELETLDLCSTQVSDAGFDRLKVLPKLQHLWVVGTHVTAAGVARLQAALPNCEIHHGEF